MNVLLVTSWGDACGIAEHSAMLIEAVERADPSILISADAEALDPDSHSVRALVHDGALGGIDVVHLNYQDALHSRWTVPHILMLRAAGYPVVVTYHDTGVPNSDRCKAILTAASASVVHEPCDDLPESTHYWRMGVPEWTQPPAKGLTVDGRPILGTIGFPAAYKNYDGFAALTFAAGWDLLLIAPGATIAQVTDWQARNPGLIVRGDFVPRGEALSLLAGCDATAFFYTGAYTGQSGALPMGVGARKPVFALRTCRQFRALYDDARGRAAIRWIDNLAELETLLTARSAPTRGTFDAGIMALAAQDSWARMGERYANLYRRVRP